MKENRGERKKMLKENCLFQIKNPDILWCRGFVVGAIGFEPMTLCL